jgi:hypothetical protein
LFKNDIYALALTLFEFENPKIEKKELKAAFESRSSPYFSEILKIEDLN